MSDKTNILGLLRQKGWFGKIDCIAIVASIAIPTYVALKASLVLSLLALLIILALWSILLLYRAIYFAIIILTEIETMPAVSARLAVKFLRTIPTEMPR